MSLEIKNLTKKFGEQTALNNINIEIKKNEIIGLLGPNGAGKSTLMKSIVGVLKVDEGEIIFDGKNIAEKLNITNDDPVNICKIVITHLDVDKNYYTKLKQII